MADAARLAALAELERAEAEFVAAEFRWRHTTRPTSTTTPNSCSLRPSSTCCSNDGWRPPAVADNDRICGVPSTRGRGPCTRRPAPGETRCSLHGGAVGRVRRKPEEPAVPAPVVKATSMLLARDRRAAKREAALAGLVEQQARGLVIRKLTAKDVQRLEAAKARRRSSPVIQGGAP